MAYTTASRLGRRITLSAQGGAVANRARNTARRQGILVFGPLPPDYYGFFTGKPGKQGYLHTVMGTAQWGERRVVLAKMLGSAAARENATKWLHHPPTRRKINICSVAFRHDVTLSSFSSRIWPRGFTAKRIAQSIESNSTASFLAPGLARSGDIQVLGTCNSREAKADGFDGTHGGRS